VYYKENYYTITKNQKSAVPKNKAKEYGLTWSGIFGANQLTYNGLSYMAYQMVWQLVNGNVLPKIAKDCYVDDLKPLGKNIYNMALVSKGKKANITVKAVMPIKHLFAYPAEDWQKKYDEIMARIKQEETRLAAQFAVYRTFEVNSTGYHNWDRVYHRPDKVMVNAVFKFDKGIENQDDIEIYYFVENNKGFVKFIKGQTDSIMMVPDSTAKFIAVISESEAAVFSSGDYNKINFNKLKSGKSYSFDMKTVAVNSREDFLKLVSHNY